MEIMMRPIGVIHSPFHEGDETPSQSYKSKATGQVEVYPEFAEGLEDVEGFSHIFLLWLLDRSPGYELHIVPFADDQPRGLFSTRYPGRPNPIGLSVVRVLGRHDNILDVEGVDMWDETPLLDIKPYIPIVDAWTDARTGWYGERSQTEKRPSL